MSSWARGLNFVLSLDLHPYLMYTSSDGSGEFAHMHSCADWQETSLLDSAAVICIQANIYTETIKLCPLFVYVCQFQMYERISFKFSHYQLLSFKKVLQLR